MKIATKVFEWDDPNAGAGVASFYVYYRKVEEGEPPVFGYDDPHLVVPAVQGQPTYSLELPGSIPLTEGVWALGLAAADPEGNISDIVVLLRPFDFTAPAAPENLRVR